jgi:hypothetical protein
MRIYEQNLLKYALCYSWKCEFKQPYKYIVFLVLAPMYKEFTWVILFDSGYSSRHDFTEIFYMDIFCLRGFR